MTHRVFVIEVAGFDLPIRIVKSCKEEAIRWFNRTYPTRKMLNIHEW